MEGPDGDGGKAPGGVWVGVIIVRVGILILEVEVEAAYENGRQAWRSLASDDISET